MEKLIIAVALSGAETTREDNPNLPVTAREIGEAACECCRAGAALIHLHVRKDDGTPTQDAAAFKAAMDEIREKCDIIVQVSTGGAVWMSAEERIQPVYLKPEMATLTAGTVNFGNDVFSNPPEYLEKFARAMQDQGVKPEIEVFEVGMINNARYLARKGLIEEPMHYDFVMGVPGGIPASLKNLLHLVESIPPESTWTVAGIGRHELPLATAAILLGGHVRVGFEDNIFFEKGVLAESNAQLVQRVVEIARIHGREVATPGEARRILRLPSNPG